MNNFKVYCDGYTLAVKELGIGYMIVANPREVEFRVEFKINDKKDYVIATSVTRKDSGEFFCVWCHIPQKLRQAILDGETF